jgi:hypothetical protein
VASRACAAARYRDANRLHAFDQRFNEFFLTGGPI